jgi:hypothetical protein
MMIHGRLHEVQAWGGSGGLLPPNSDYVFLIEAAAIETSSGKGVPQLCINVKVLNTGEVQGRTGKFWYNLNFEKGKARERLKALTDACAVALDANGSFDDQQVVGRQFMADVVADSYDKVDPTTNQKITKDTTRIQNERALNGAAGATQPGVGFAPAPAAAGQPAAFGRPGLTPVRQ